MKNALIDARELESALEYDMEVVYSAEASRCVLVARGLSIEYINSELQRDPNIDWIEDWSR